MVFETEVVNDSVFLSFVFARKGKTGWATNLQAVERELGGSWKRAKKLFGFDKGQSLFEKFDGHCSFHRGKRGGVGG